MKSKIIIASLIGAILFVSLVYGGVLNYYGKIVGNINVQPPVFYAHSEKETYEKNNYGMYKANVQADGPEVEIGSLGLTGSHVFLNGFQNYKGWLLPYFDSFYSSTWNFYYRVKVAGSGNVVENKAKFYVKLYKFNTQTGEKTLLQECGNTREVSENEGYTTVSGTCSISSLSFSTDERLLVEYWAEITNAHAQDITYVYISIDNPNISKEYQTRIEVIKS